MKAFCDEFFASPAFANDQHRAIERCGPARTFDAIEKGAGFADELVGTFHTQYLGYYPNL